MELRKKLIWVKLWKLIRQQEAKWNLLFLILKWETLSIIFRRQAEYDQYFIPEMYDSYLFWRRISHYQQDSPVQIQ